jgi:preprotein translocase subunit YajC
MQMLDTIMNFFVPMAHADTATTAAATQPAPSGFPMMFLMGGLLLLMYFMVIRPQNKRAKEQREIIGSLTKGDEVVTASGILGVIVKITDNHIILALNESVNVPVLKSSVISVMPKGTLKSI